MSYQISWLTPPSRALIVGINEYDHVPKLRGCVKDALEVGSFLLKELGMKPDQIALLTSPAYKPKRGNKLFIRHAITEFLDEQPTPDEVRLLKRGTLNATRANIITGIREFLGGAQPGEEVLFYYSGHGSTNKLTEEIGFGDEKGETLVPADAGFKVDETTNTRQETCHILDRELRVLIDELLEKGIGLTLIADSCHSGGISRGIPDRIKTMRSLSKNNGDEEIARFTEPNHTPRDLASLLNGTVESEIIEKLYTGPARPHTHTLIAGCLPDQLSYEVKGKDGRYRGAMTSALLQTFRSANGPISYRELGRALRANVPEHYNKTFQHPQITGVQERLIFTTNEVPRKAPLFAVVKVKNRCIELDGGQIEGINKNSVLTCYADWSLTRPLGQWKVSKSLPDSARAAPFKGADPMMAKPGQPLTLDTSPERPKVFFCDSAKEIAEAWRHCWRGNQKPEELSEESWDDDCYWTLSGKGSSSSADLKQEEQDSRPTLKSSDSSAPIKSNQEQAPSEGACSSLSGLDPNQEGAQDDKPSSIIDSFAGQEEQSEESRDDEGYWTLSGKGSLSSADLKPEEEDSRPTVSSSDWSVSIKSNPEQAPSEGAWHNSLLWRPDPSQEATDYNPLSKGAPYLVETFTGNAHYTVEVEDRMLLVRGPDDTLVEALHHKIQTNEEARRTTDPRKRRSAHDLAFLMDRVICYHDFVAKAPDKNKLNIDFSGEEPEIKVTVERLVRDISITVRNQNRHAKPVHVNLYRLDPDEYIAERIWPADATDQLPWGASSSAPLPREIGQKGLLHFKLFVSTTPLMLEKWPCGKPHKNRGATMASVRPIRPRFKGWATYNFEVELPKRAKS